MSYWPPLQEPFKIFDYNDFHTDVIEIKNWLMEIRSRLDAVKTYEKNGPIPFEYDYCINTYDTSNNVTSTVYRTGGANGSVVATIRYTYDSLGNMLTMTRTLN